MSPGSGDPGRRLAARRLLAALGRLHRREPLKADHRADTVIGEARSDPAERRPGHHRGGGSLAGLSDADLRAVLDDLVTDGRLLRAGHRVRLPGHEPAIDDPEMRDRVHRLLGGLRELGADVPRLEPIAARLGIPVGVLDQLRSSGELVRVGDGVEYPREVLESLSAYIDEAARHGPLTIARLRDELRVSRRHAEALIAWRADRRRQR